VNAPAPRLVRRARVDLKDFPVDAAWAPDGARALVGLGEGALALLDLRGAEPVATEIGRHAGGVLAVAWQAAGARFATSGQDGRVLLWDSRTLESRELVAQSEWCEHLAFARNGKWLAVAVQKQLRIFDAEGVERASFANQPGVINALAWRPKPPTEIAAVSQGGAHVYELEPRPDTLALRWNAACMTASWSPDGRILASGMRENGVHYWNLPAGTQSEMKGYPGKVTLTGFSGNNRFLATGAGELIVVWNVGGDGPEGSVPLQLKEHSDRLTQLAFQPEGALLASGARDRRVLLWQPAQGTTPIDADLLGEEVALLRWSRDGQRLLAGDRAGALNIYALSASSAAR
jgi:WD40 repeat protein